MAKPRSPIVSPENSDYENEDRPRFYLLSSLRGTHLVLDEKYNYVFPRDPRFYSFSVTLPLLIDLERS